MDIRTEATNLDGRQVVVVGDPSVNLAVVGVRSQDLALATGNPTDYGLVVRHAGSISVNVTQLSGTAVDANSGLKSAGTQRVIIATDQPQLTNKLLVTPDSVALPANQSVNISQVYGTTNGTLQVRIDPGYAVVNTSATIVIPSTVSGQYAGNSASGLTLVGPTSGRAIKVCSYSLSTTGISSIFARFTNGRDVALSPTEFWRVALQSPASVASGANFGVSPPGFLFATAAGSTLSLVLDSGTLVHYSVSFFEESA